MLFERLAPEFRSERVDVFGIKIEPERIASGNQPALDRIRQVQMAALAVGQDAIAVLRLVRGPVALGPRETEPVVEGLRGVEVIAGQDGSQSMNRRHSKLPA
jgi:hypothetical protein